MKNNLCKKARKQNLRKKKYKSRMVVQKGTHYKINILFLTNDIFSVF
jgi:hypothetical protein